MSLWRRFRGTFFKGRTDSLVQQELEFHIEQRADELIAGGCDKAEAVRRARLEFGNPSKWREETRDADVFVAVENWMRDTRQSIRGLRHRPIFTLTTVASLAIGIGAVASIFSVADAVVWKPIALPHSDELYDLQEAKRGEPSGSNGPRLKDWQTLSSIRAATGTYGETLVWRGVNGNEPVRCLRTFSGFMATAQPPMIAGRGFTAEEESGVQPVVLATHAFWRDRLNSRAAEAIELSGKSYRVVGVLDPAVRYPDGYDLWIPAPANLQNGTRQASYLDVMLRLKPGTTAAEAQAEVKLAAARLAQAYPKTDANLSASIVPLRDDISRGARKSLIALLAIVGCVLAMICVNIAALLLSRSTERERESSLRSALGASPASLIRLYLIEAMLLSLAGGIAGVMLATAGVEVLKSILPSDFARLADAQVDARVLACALLTAVAAAFFSGLVPAWLASRKMFLHESARGSSARADRMRVRTVFVIVEIALSVLLVSTGFRLGQAFLELSTHPGGFRAAEVLTVSVPFPWTVQEDRLHNFTARALERFGTLPGVTKTGLIDQYPLLGGTQDADVQIEGVVAGGGGGGGADPHRSGIRSASPGYFEALGVPVVEGRIFDSRPGRAEVVVNQTFAKRFLAAGGRPATAYRVMLDKGGKWYQVTGVVADIPLDPARQAGATPEVFVLYSNNYWPLLNFVLRTTTPASVLAPLIRDEVARLDGTVIVKSVVPLQNRLNESTAGSEVRSALAGAAAVLALLLMAIGVHGLVAGDVATRWREFGIRLALGATVPSVRLLLIRKIAGLTLVGVAAGMAAMLLTSKLLASSFQGLPPVNPATVGAVCAAIALAAVGAILWPLYRISRIDPSAALRHE